MHARRGDLLERALLRGRHDDAALGSLGIGRESAVAVDQVGLAGVGKRHELDGLVAADLARIGRDHAVVDAQALVDACVRDLHVAVALVEALARRVEAVGVFHDELARAEQAEARAHLVAELDLHLPQRARELLVAAQLVADEVGDELLVCRPEADLAVVAVGEAHHLGTVVVPATRLVPELGGL